MSMRKDARGGCSSSWAANAPTSSRSLDVEEQSLQLTVVFTTVQGTLAALKKAGHWAHQLGARIRVLVPHVVSYALPLERPPVDPLFKVRKFRTWCCADGVDTRFDVRLCRDASECLKQALNHESIILVGGRRRLFPTRAQRLAKSLSRTGHQVIFVDEDEQLTPSLAEAQSLEFRT